MPAFRIWGSTALVVSSTPNTLLPDRPRRDRLKRTVNREAGIVQEHVNPTEPLGPGRNGLPDRFRVRHVQACNQHVFQLG